MQRYAKSSASSSHQVQRMPVSRESLGGLSFRSCAEDSNSSTDIKTQIEECVGIISSKCSTIKFCPNKEIYRDQLSLSNLNLYVIKLIFPNQVIQ